MKWKDEMTWGEVLRPAMKIKTQEKADEYLAEYVAWIMKQSGVSRRKATETAKNNIGYWAGYYDDETARRVYKLFNCAHPYLGR